MNNIEIPFNGKNAVYKSQSLICFCLIFHSSPVPRRIPSADANSRKQESEWKEKAKLELEDWHARQNEQLEKAKSNNR